MNVSQAVCFSLLKKEVWSQPVGMKQRYSFLWDESGAKTYSVQEKNISINNMQHHFLAYFTAASAACRGSFVSASSCVHREGD